MASYISIQFYGIDQVMDAAKNRACPGWAIFQGRPAQFLFKYQINDLDSSLQFLEKILSSLESTGNEAAYTIKFFEHEGNKDLKIKENSPCDGSFNFRLIEEEERQQRKTLYQGTSNKVLEKLEGIENRLLQIEQGHVEEVEEDNTLQGQIVGMLKEPSRLNEFIAALANAKSLLGIGPAAPAYVGNINRAGQILNQVTAAAPAPVQNLSLTEEQKLQRLGNAIDTLEKNDPQIVDHLEKLASMAVNNPSQFKNLLSMLDIMS